MRPSVRRVTAKAHITLTAGALGALAAVGLVKAVPEPVEADLAASSRNVITIRGENIVDGSIKFRDLDGATVRKGLANVFLKLTKAATDYLKIKDADSRYVKLAGLTDYVKLSDADARYIKLDGLSDYIKLSDADTRYVKIAMLSDYLKVSDADARFEKFMKITDADARYLKLADVDSAFQKHLTDYIKLDAADARYFKLDSVESAFQKHLTDYMKLDAADARFLKLDDVAAAFEKQQPELLKLTDARYVSGNGRVQTGSARLTQGQESAPLLTVSGVLSAEAIQPAAGAGGGPHVKLSNVSSNPLYFVSSDGSAGQIDQGSSVDVLSPGKTATVQVTGAPGGSARVVTLSCSMLSVSAGLVVSCQALSGSPSS